MEKVRKNPPGDDQLRELEDALEDPELQLRRKEGEPVLGYGSLALTDNLTLLYTRRYLHETAQAEALRSERWGQPFTVIFVELTDISRLNSREGYAAGDEAIRAAARGLQRIAVRVGCTACRYSGHRLGLVAPAAGGSSGR